MITRLARIYLKICDAGCMLFRCWKAVFYFDKSLTFSANITFGESSRPICGSTDDVLEQINEMCTFLQECLDAWVQHVDKQRKAYYHLNFFSTEQLVMIQNELARLRKNGKPNKCVYPLLAAIKDNISYEELQVTKLLICTCFAPGQS